MSQNESVKSKLLDVYDELAPDPDEALWWEIITLVYYCRPEDLAWLSRELAKKFRVISSRSIS